MLLIYDSITYVLVTFCAVIAATLIFDMLRMIVRHVIPYIFAFSVFIPSAFDLIRTCADAKLEIFWKLRAPR